MWYRRRHDTATQTPFYRHLQDVVIQMSSRHAKPDVFKMSEIGRF